jgi:hypothetical protein
MYKTLTFADFCSAFRNHGRENQFSPEAKFALYEYLTNLEEETGKKIELDVIALCCDYTEEDVETIIKERDLNASECADDDDRHDLVKDFLKKTTQIVWSDGNRFLFESF